MLNKTIGGFASTESKSFGFAPTVSEPGVFKPFFSHGTGQLNSDGSFDFCCTPRIRAASTLLKKLTHGRLSKTKDGAIQLTLKIYDSEMGVNPANALRKEALEAASQLDWIDGVID